MAVHFSIFKKGPLKRRFISGYDNCTVRTYSTEKQALKLLIDMIVGEESHGH